MESEKYMIAHRRLFATEAQVKTRGIACQGQEQNLEKERGLSRMETFVKAVKAPSKEFEKVFLWIVFLCPEIYQFAAQAGQDIALDLMSQRWKTVQYSGGFNPAQTSGAWQGQRQVEHGKRLERIYKAAPAPFRPPGNSPHLSSSHCVKGDNPVGFSHIPA